MFLSVFSDELKLDYRQSIPIIAEWGCRYVDLRGLINKKLIEFQTKEELLELRQFLNDSGFTVGVLQTSLGKIHLPDNEKFAIEKKKLEGIISAAEILGCNKIRAFNFWQPPQSTVPLDSAQEAELFQTSLNMFEPIAKLAEQAGLIIGFENCGQSHTTVKKVLDYYNVSGWGMAWDVYNQYQSGSLDDLKTEEENKLISECLSYTNMIHVKAASIIPELIKGKAPWRKILRVISALGGNIPISIETHNPAGSVFSAIEATKTAYYMMQDLIPENKSNDVEAEPFTRIYANDPVRYVVVGLGMGRTRARQITSTSGTQLVGVCDINENKAKTVGDELNVRYSADINDFLSDPNVEAMYIVTPTGTHCDIAVKCLEAGKHVLVTKPMDVNAYNCKRAIDFAKDKNLLFGLDFDIRITQKFLELKKAVEENWFGDILSMTSRLFTKRTDAYFKENGAWRGTWRLDGGGAFANQGIHEIDRIYAILGMPERVCSTVKTRMHDIETEDIGSSQWEYKNGTVATFYSTTCHPSADWHVRIEVVGTKGAYTYISGGPEGTHVYWCDSFGKWSERAPYPQKQLFRQGSDSFAYSLRMGEPLLVSAQDGLFSRVLLDCMYESAYNQQGNWVDVGKTVHSL